MIDFGDITLRIHRQTLLEKTGLVIRTGEKAVLRGPSGSGKSSLLKSALGMLPIAEGRITICGIPLDAENIGAIRSRVAFIGQEPVLGAETVRDALLLPFTYKAHRHNRPDQQVVCDTLASLHLGTDMLEKPCQRISGGEKQRIAIARALLLDKSVFLADEITSALDPESKAAVIDALFRPGITLLSVSHDPDWLAACDRIVEVWDRKLKEAVHGQ